MIRIGIIGASKIAPHAIIDPAKNNPDCRVVAIASRDQSRAESYAAEHGIPEVESDYHSLNCRDDIDMVFVGLVPSAHIDVTIDALEQGKHVLCEKPIACNADETRKMFAAAQKANRTLLEGFHYRFHPAFIRALSIFQSGGIGSVRSFKAHFHVPLVGPEHKTRFDLSLGGGSLMDLGCYPLHWARTIIGGEPEILSAKAVQGDPGVDISMQASMRFAGSVDAKISASMAADAKIGAEMTIAGDAGILHMLNPLHPSMGHLITVTKDGDDQTEKVDGGPTYDYQLAHFLSVIKNGEKSLLKNDDAINNMAAIDAIYKAADMQPRGLTAHI